MSEPTSVYLYYDKLGVLLYVGITSRGRVRQDEHSKQAEWWRHSVHQEIKHFDSRGEALFEERRLIIERRPPFNRQHNPDHARLKAAYLILFHPEVLDDDADADDWARCWHCAGCLHHRIDPDGEWGCRYWPDSDNPGVCLECEDPRCPYPSGYDAGLIDGYTWDSPRNVSDLTEASGAPF